MEGCIDGDIGPTLTAVCVFTSAVLRALLDRLEDSRTGRVVDSFQVECPPEKKEEAKMMAELNKEGLYDFAGFLPECAVRPCKPLAFTLSDVVCLCS